MARPKWFRVGSVIFLSMMILFLGMGIFVRQRNIPNVVIPPSNVLDVKSASKEVLPDSERGNKEVFVRGVFHVHSELSHDSTLSFKEIARAARDAQLDFVVLTDHNRQWQAPRYIEGVLMMSFAELSTPLGHLIQLGDSHLRSYKERQSKTVLKEIQKGKGAPILSHPTSPKRPWEGEAVDSGLWGGEIASASTSVRHLMTSLLHSPMKLMAALTAYVVRPKLLLIQLYRFDEKALAVVDGLPQGMGLCGVDAHGWLPLAANLKVWNIRFRGGLSGDSKRDQSQILSAMMNNRFICESGLFSVHGRLPVPVFSSTMGLNIATRITVDRLQLNKTQLNKTQLGQLRYSGSFDNTWVVLLHNGKEVASFYSQKSVTLFNRSSGARDWPLGVYRAALLTKVPKLLYGTYNAAIAYSPPVIISAYKAADEGERYGDGRDKKGVQ